MNLRGFWFVVSMTCLSVPALGCSSRQPPRVQSIINQQPLEVDAFTINAIAALPLTPTMTLVAWTATSNSDTTGLVSTFRSRTCVATFDDSSGVWSSPTCVDSVNGEPMILFRGAGALRLALTNSVRTFASPDGVSWRETPGLTMPTQGRLRAVHAMALGGDRFAIAYSMSIPGGLEELWYQECDADWTPILAERIAVGSDPERTSLGIRILPGAESPMVIGMLLKEGASDERAQLGVFVRARQGGAWKPAPGRRLQGLLKDEGSDLRGFDARTGSGKLWLAFNRNWKHRTLVTRVEPDVRVTRADTLSTGELYPVVSPSVSPLCVCPAGVNAGVAWIASETPRDETGKVIPATAGMMKGMLYVAMPGQEPVCATPVLKTEDALHVTCLTTTQTPSGFRVWFGTTDPGAMDAKSHISHRRCVLGRSDVHLKRY